MNTRTRKWGILALILSTAYGVAALPGDWQVRQSKFSGRLNGLAAAPGQLIAVGQGGAILTSADGFSWTRVPFTPASGDFHCVTFGKDLYVAGGTLDCLLAISPDGVNWTSIQSTDSIRAHFGVAYGAGRFVVVGQGGGGFTNSRLLTSTNGTDWEGPPKPTTNILRAVAFGNGKYVAVGEHGTIITSPDALTWTLQNSGTEHHLRSVIFTGWEFLAGGDSSTLLTSGDGISWLSVPFSSFDVRGLATCGTATVAVGALGAGGRVQASTDGLSWHQSPSSFASPLNAVLHYGLGEFIAVGNRGLILAAATWADAPVNLWAKTTNGYWDESFWSLGHMPSWQDQSVVFTNGGSKTLEIDAVTSGAYPESLHVRELILGAAEGSHNALLLNAAGHDVPLRVETVLQIQPNASLVSTASAMLVFTLDLAGSATFDRNSDTRVEIIALRGQLRLTGGALSPAEIVYEGGILQADGPYALGPITVRGNGTLDFQTGSTLLQFESSADMSWNAGTFLTVSNWTPSIDQLFIGHNQTGLTTAQLSQIRFVNPGGFSPGLYSARITSTGEVVPVPRFISYQRSASQLTLHWPEGYGLLTATNVAGPYSLITNAISPYKASYTDPQRFFIVGHEN